MSGADGDSQHAANDLNALVQLVQRLAGDKHFQNISGQYEEIPRLKGRLDATEQLLERRNEETKALKAECDAIYRKNLQLYSEERDVLNTTVRSLREKADESTKAIAQKNTTIMQMKTEEMKAKKRVEELEKLLKIETQKYDKEVVKIKELENNKFKTQHEMESLEDQLEKKSDIVAELEKTKTDLEGQKDSLAQQNGTLLGNLQAIEALATPLDENKLEDSIVQFESLWEEARQLIELHFHVDLDADKFQDPGVWSGFKDEEKLGSKIPIPQSNTINAKNMRVAAILAILARSVDRNIFQPTYHLDFNSGLRELFVQQATESSRRESWCRAFLLSMFPQYQERVAAEGCARVVHEAVSVVQGLLPGEQIDRFRIRLKQFTESAVDTWKRIQRIREKLESDFGTTVYEEMRWQTLKLDGGTVSNSEGAGVNNIEDTSEVRLVVFPRLYVVDDTKTVPVTTGVVLKKSQCEGAQREMDETQPGSPVIGRPLDAGARRRFSRNDEVALNGTTTQGRTFLG